MAGSTGFFKNTIAAAGIAAGLSVNPSGAGTTGQTQNWARTESPTKFLDSHASSVAFKDLTTDATDFAIIRKDGPSGNLDNLGLTVPAAMIAFQDSSYTTLTGRPVAIAADTMRQTAPSFGSGAGYSAPIVG